MRTTFIIVIALVITVLNIKSYGDLDANKLEQAKIIAQSDKEIVLEENYDWSNLGVNLFKLFHFAELMLISEVSRKNFFDTLKLVG